MFVERDGILNRARRAGRYQAGPLTLAEFRINRAAVWPLRQLKARGFVLIATTNQPGLSRGHLLRREMDLMHELLRRTFWLDDVLVCPHEALDDCPCHKPRPGLLREAAFKWHLDLEHSFVVSDKWPDAEAARWVGCTSLLLDSPWIGPVHHDFILPDLDSIANKIVELSHAGYCLFA